MKRATISLIIYAALVSMASCSVDEDVICDCETLVAKDFNEGFKNVSFRPCYVSVESDTTNISYEQALALGKSQNCAQR